MRLEELYAKFDEILRGMNVSTMDKFVFDLADESSLNSIKGAFPGIESILMPECGQYLVVSTIVEDPNCLVMLFPEQTDGKVSLKAFNTTTKKSADLTGTQVAGMQATIDNFKDFANMEEITRRFNEFAFSTSGENSTNEVPNIGSFDISNDEPVAINNTNTDNEETEMKFKPINEEIEGTNEPKWVEIPNSNAGSITVTEDDAAGGDDPFAGEIPADGNVEAPPAPEGDAGAEGGDAAPAEGDAAAAPEGGDASAEAPADGGDDAAAPEGDATTDDPKAKMRELLAYYTNYMTELVQDPNTSTELISATQEMIDSLIKNMESADGIEEAKAEGEEAAKEDVTASEAPAEETPAPEGDASAEPVAEETEEENKVDDEQAELDAKIDAEVDAAHADDWEDIQPATSDNILTPGDLKNSAVNDVDLTGTTTPDEELMGTSPDLAAPAPTSDVDVMADTADLSPDEEDSLLGVDDMDGMIGPDGLPVDKYEGDVEALAPTTVSKKISWSPDYATSGVATSDDSQVVVPGAIAELASFYTNVADQISKVPGKEDIALKLQKIQTLTQTIANEWSAIAGSLCDCGCCANSYDRSNMCDIEKDEIDSVNAMGMVGADVMADQEQEEEDDLAIMEEIQKFAESFKHLI